MLYGFAMRLHGVQPFDKHVEVGLLLIYYHLTFWEQERTLLWTHGIINHIV